MIRGSDGLDYEDLGARLLGEPADTGRNSVLGPGSHYDKAFKADYRETYDYHEEQGHTSLDCHRAAFAQACIGAGIQPFGTQARDDRLDAGIWFANYAGKPGAGLTTGDFGVVTYDPSVLF